MAKSEKERLKVSQDNTAWKLWGPYLSERQWGTVREDYSEDGSAWESVTHDMARSNAYRWGEDGLGGISDAMQYMCFAWAFWNGKDGLLKERMYGVTGNQGNHGEDVKELYYYLDSTPSHSYMKMLYKYPQQEFPYNQLREENEKRDKSKPELELIDTGIFDKDEYFDIFMEYAKNDVNDILVRADVHNRGPKEAELTVIPTAWFRNQWRLEKFKDLPQPKMELADENTLYAHHPALGDYYVHFEEGVEIQFCENETNRKRIYNTESPHNFFKDGINDYVVHGKKDAVNPDKTGTKAAGIIKLKIKGGENTKVRVRISKAHLARPFDKFDAIFSDRKKEADHFYEDLQQQVTDSDLANIQRQAYAGMMWTKQFYYYNIKEWLEGDPGKMPPPEKRKKGRNSNWTHLENTDIISMPDKWEYPWYAAWDSAFHCIPLARIDPDFAKEQLLLFLKENYMHPNGQIPAYEWNFGDVNPPVHAWAVLRVFHMDRKANQGKADFDFLEKAFHKLLLNFTWWVNQKDRHGSNVFEGGFLGLDNIGVFDRSNPIPGIGKIEQADASSWMAMFSLNMLRMSLDLAEKNQNYEDMAIKFFEHFLYIAGAINNVKDQFNTGLWDDEDKFYYDVIHFQSGKNQRMKVRSMVGLIPLFAVETLKAETYEKLPKFRKRLEFFLKERPKLANMVSRWHVPGEGERRLLSLLRGYRMNKMIQRMVDEAEFLSHFGIRALSKYHKKYPYEIEMENGDVYSVNYQPGESDSYMFGGNSNWRGPIWFPVNYMILESLRKFYFYYGDEFKVEFPTGSGEMYNLQEVAEKLAERLMKIFSLNNVGARPVFGRNEKFQKDPHFKDYILFYEYFHGDNGRGCGASHQTGWTGLIADIIYKYYQKKDQLVSENEIPSEESKL